MGGGQAKTVRGQDNGGRGRGPVRESWRRKKRRAKISREGIEVPGEDMERDKNVSDGENNFTWDSVRGCGGYEADKWESGGSDGEKYKESLDADKTEETGEEE